MTMHLIWPKLRIPQHCVMLASFLYGLGCSLRCYLCPISMSGCTPHEIHSLAREYSRTKQAH